MLCRLLKVYKAFRIRFDIIEIQPSALIVVFGLFVFVYIFKMCVLYADQL